MSLTLSPPGSTEEGKTLSALLLEHKEDLILCVTQLRPILEFLETAKEEFLTGAERRVTVSSISSSLLNLRSTVFNLSVARSVFSLAVFLCPLHRKHPEVHGLDPRLFVPPAAAC